MKTAIRIIILYAGLLLGVWIGRSHPTAEVRNQWRELRDSIAQMEYGIALRDSTIAKLTNELAKKTGATPDVTVVMDFKDK